jgi:membrane protease YdiL (CAAX protease family)
LGDAAIGVVASILLSTLAVGLIIGIGDYASTDDLPLWLQTAAEIPLWAGLLGAIALACSKGARLRDDLRLLVRWTDVPLGLACGFVGQIAIVIIVLPLYKLLGIDTDEVGQTAEKLADRAVHAPDVALLLVLVVVGAPVVEELFYRGLVLRAAERRCRSSAPRSRSAHCTSSPTTCLRCSSSACSRRCSRCAPDGSGPASSPTWRST